MAGVFAFFLLAMAGIPLTVRLRRQVGGLRGGAVCRRLAGGLVAVADQHPRRVLLHPGDRADVLLRADRRRPERRRAPACSPPPPSRFGAAATLVLGVVPGPVLDLAGQCGRIRQVTIVRPSALALAGPRRRALADRLRDRMAVVEEALAGHVHSRAAVRHRGGPAPAGGRRQAVPAAAGAARGRDRCHARLRRRDHRGLRRRADPPRVALPRRRHGRGGPAPRRRLGQRAVGQPRRDPHRRLPLLQVLGADRRSRPRRRAHPGADVLPAGRGPDPRDRAPGPARTRSRTTSRWSPARPAR